MAADAVWRAGGAGPDVPVRVILRSPDVTIGYSDSRVASGSVQIDVRVRDVAVAASGDRVIIGTEQYLIMGQPLRDELQLVWECEARPAP